MKLIKMVHSRCLGNAQIQFGPMCTFGLFFAKNGLQTLFLRSSKKLSDRAIIFPGLFSLGMPIYFE